MCIEFGLDDIRTVHLAALELHFYFSSNSIIINKAGNIFFLPNHHAYFDRLPDKVSVFR